MATETFDTVIHLGGGYCREIDSHLASGAARIVLVEADPAIVSDLRRRFGNEPRINIVEAAVAAKSGAATFFIYNHPSVSSIRPANKSLRNRYPGLRLVKELKVQAVSVDAFVLGLALADDNEHVLFVDTPGEEAAILAALIETGLASRFKLISARCPGAMYEGGQPIDKVLNFLSRAGLKVTQDGEDPDFPVLEARRGPEIAAKQKMAEYEDKLRETQYRQSLIDEELKRVEVQIELIKDVLIRDKVF